MWSFLKDKVISGGTANREMRILKEDMQKTLRKHGRIAERNMIRLQKAIRGYLGKNPTKEQVEYLDAAMKDPDVMRTLPKPLRRAALIMRDHLNALSEYVNEYVEDDTELSMTIEENGDVYVTRTYKKFEGPKWAKKALADEEIMRNFIEEARQILRDQYSEDVKNYEKEFAKLYRDAGKPTRNVGTKTKLTKEAKRLAGIYNARAERERKQNLKDRQAAIMEGETKLERKKLAAADARIEKARQRREDAANERRPLQKRQIEAEKVRRARGKRAREVAEMRPGPYVEATIEELRTLAERLLNKDAEGIHDLLDTSPRARRFYDILKRRKNLSPAMRALYGENTNVYRNYQMSVARMAYFAATKEFTTELKRVGLENGFFSEAEDLSSGFAHKVNGKIPELGDLADVYMDKDMARALNSHFSNPSRHIALRILVSLAAIPKVEVTVLSWPAVMRQLWGGIQLAGEMVANPFMLKANIAHGFEALHLSLIADTRLGDIAWVQNLSKAIGHDVATGRELIDRMHELRLEEDVSMAEFGTIADEAAGRLADLDEISAAKNWTSDKARKTWKFLTRLFAFWDIVRKRFKFLAWVPRYQKAYPDWSKERVEEHTADLIVNTDPTYSLASKAAKVWSRYNFAQGDFSMFNFETIRGRSNLIRAAITEINSDNPELKKLGWEKFVGMALATFGATQLVKMYNRSNGVSEEEEDEIHRLVPSYATHSDLAISNIDKVNGVVEMTNMSYTDPYSIFKKSIYALMDGKPADAAYELASPFVQEGMLFSTVIDLWRGFDKDGHPSYDKGVTWDEQISQMAEYAHRRLTTPGTITGLRRIADSPAEDKSKEERGFVLGIRSVSMDIKKSYGFVFRNHGRMMKESDNAITGALKGYGAKKNWTEEDIMRLYVSAETKRKKVFDEWADLTRKSTSLGIAKPLDLLKFDKRGSYSNTTAEDVYFNEYTPYRPSDTANGTLAYLQKKLAEAPKDKKPYWKTRLDIANKLLEISEAARTKWDEARDQKAKPTTKP